MTSSPRSIAGLLALSTLAALAACGRSATVSDELQQDLQQASTAAVELAPRAPQTQVVSAIELGRSEAPTVKAPEPTPARKAPSRAKAPAQTRRTPVRQVAVARAPERAPEPQPVAEAPAVVAEAPAPQEEPAPITVSAPVPAPPSRTPAPSRVPARRGNGNGGWWSTGDVIRNAPFPINP